MAAATKAGRAKGVLLGAAQQGQSVLALLPGQNIPEGFLIIAVQVSDIPFQVGDHLDVSLILRVTA